MDAGQARAAASAAKQNNRVFYGGIAAAALLGYYWYKKRSGDVHNVGDAVRRLYQAINMRSGMLIKFVPLVSLSGALLTRPCLSPSFVKASRAGASVGRGMESAGESIGGRTGAALKDEGKGFQAKQQ